MTNLEILKAAIERAIANGWDVFGGLRCRDFDRWETDADCGSESINIWYKEPVGFRPYRTLEIIFNHDFAKAFAKYLISLNPGDTSQWVEQTRYWRQNDGPFIDRVANTLLIEMVLAPEPLKYLERFMEGKP